MKKLKNDYDYDIQYELNTKYIFNEIIKNQFIYKNIDVDVVNGYDGCFILDVDEKLQEVEIKDVDNFIEKFNQTIKKDSNDINKLKITMKNKNYIYYTFSLNKDKYNTIEICSLYNDLEFILNKVVKDTHYKFPLKTLYISNCKLDGVDFDF